MSVPQRILRNGSEPFLADEVSRSWPKAKARSPAGCRVDLTGQVALVTGASRGIGRAIAVGLASLRRVDRRQSPARSRDCKERSRRSAKPAARPKGYAVDVSKSEDVQRAVEEIESKFQRIHILVNNAGITRDGLVLRMEDSAWQDVIDTNLKGTFLFCRAVGACMMRGRYGRIINISSVSGLMGNPGQANYSASKAGVIGFSKTIARELASRNITVNVVAPGFITTDMTERLAREDQDRGQGSRAAAPAGNAGRHRRPGALPGEPGRQLPDRPGDRGRWRDDGLSGNAERGRGGQDRSRAD